jgi:hypothetical protein
LHVAIPKLTLRRKTMAKAKVTKAQALAPVRKTIADNTAAKAPKTIREHAERKVREAKLAAGRAKQAVRTAGTAAKAHVTRNKAAYIAGGAGLAAGAIGGAVMSRRNRSQD